MENGSTDKTAGPEPQVHRKSPLRAIGPNPYGVVGGFLVQIHLESHLRGLDLIRNFCAAVSL